MANTNTGGGPEEVSRSSKPKLLQTGVARPAPQRWRFVHGGVGRKTSYRNAGEDTPDLDKDRSPST
jgi:hypothetical protein